MVLNYWQLRIQGSVMDRSLIVFSAVWFACFLLPCSAQSSATAGGPLDRYCRLVKAKVVARCAAQFTWDPAEDIDVAVDKDGMITGNYISMSSTGFARSPTRPD